MEWFPIECLTDGKVYRIEARAPDYMLSRDQPECPIEAYYRVIIDGETRIINAALTAGHEQYGDAYLMKCEPKNLFINRNMSQVQQTRALTMLLGTPLEVVTV